MSIDVKNINSVLGGLKPLENLSSFHSEKFMDSELGAFGALLAKASEPAIHAEKLAKKYAMGKVNVEEVKFAQMEEAILTDLVAKTTGKMVHIIETMSNMQI